MTPRTTLLALLFLAVGMLGAVGLLGAAGSAPPATSIKPAATLPSSTLPAEIAGAWVFDATWPPTNTGVARESILGRTCSIREEKEAVIIEVTDGDNTTIRRFHVDGTEEVVKKGDHTWRHRGAMKDGHFVINEEVDAPGPAGIRVTTVSVITIRPHQDGLIVERQVRSPVPSNSNGRYLRPTVVDPNPKPQTKPKPQPSPRPGSPETESKIEAKIAVLSWLDGAWIGTMGSSSIEERWSPPGGGAMLGVARTVRGGRMTEFEFLRIIERDGSLVYIAQPGGGEAVEFSLVAVKSESNAQEVTFENAGHDFPQRIRYTLDGDALTAEVSDLAGSKSMRFAFRREHRE